MKTPPRTNTRTNGGATAKLRKLKSGEARRVKIAGNLPGINTVAHRILGKGGYAIRRTVGGYMVFITDKAKK